MVEAVRLEQHWLSFAASAGGGGRLVRVPGAQVLVNPTSDAGFCNFILLRESADLATTLELGKAVLAGEGRAPLLFLGPLVSAIPAHALQDLGWREVARQVVLAAPLPPPVTTLNPAVVVRRAEPTELAAWGALLTEAYEVSPLAAPGIHDGYTALAADPGAAAQARFYLGELEPPFGGQGRPVGTGLAWQRGELLGLYAGAVRPEARGNGVERATLYHRMADGAAAGASWAYLQTEVGSPVVGLACRHLGFVPVYERSVWVPR
ncbi:MAG TPA: hypothetical protein VK191_04650 [Symbiobacteriaceae bacterium]|nr:hypothetical protein [Symbiobacteriaceae bacterium]